MLTLPLQEHFVKRVHPPACRAVPKPNLVPMIRTVLFTAWTGLALAAAAQEPAAPPAAAPEKKRFEFKEGDRLVLLGSTVLEREQRYATLEPALALALGDKKITVRNLAWSGDTVFGHARSYFGPPKEGLERLEKHLELLKPTVVETSGGGADVVVVDKRVQQGAWVALACDGRVVGGQRFVTSTPCGDERFTGR